jgi:CHAT domain-containing protein/Tfp pilus assembly protein PilF
MIRIALGSPVGGDPAVASLEGNGSRIEVSAAAAAVLLLTACARDPSPADLERDGASALRSGDLAAAERHVDAGMRIAEARHDATAQQRFRVLRAEVLVEQRRPADALAIVGGAVVPPGPADPLNVRLLIARGRARCLKGGDAIDPGERDLDAAAQLAAALPPGELTAGLPLYRGNCAMSRRDFPRADREFREAYATARQQRSALLEGKAAGSIGMAATRVFRFDEAVMWFERALAVAPTDLVRVKTLTNLGWCHNTLGDFEQALSFLADADALAQSRGYRGEQQLALEMAGNAHYRLRDRTRAADAFRRSLAIARELGDRPRTAELLGNLAIVALDQRQLDTAQALVAEALQIKTAIGGDAAAIQFSRMTEGQIKAAAGDGAAAERAYREVLASPDADRDLRWDARAALAELRMANGQPVEADAEFQRAFAIIEASAADVQRTDHKLSFYSRFDDFQDAYVEFLVGRGDIRRALEVADRGRAHLLREKLQDGLPAPALTASQFQQLAGAQNAAILFYWLAPSRSFVWTVSRNGIALAVLPGEDAIAAHVDAYQRLVLRSRDPLAETAADARWLYDTLVLPVQAAVPPGSRVVFVPDGALHRLNPETSPAGAPRRTTGSRDVTISDRAVDLGARVRLARARRRRLAARDPRHRRSPPSGPQFRGSSTRRARSSASPAQFAPDARTVYSAHRPIGAPISGSDAARYAFIHFAAHGIANREAPLDSAVVLSPTDDASKLYARDILRLPIRADLVTISACSGAGSRTYAGEGLVGLTWAFLTAGAGNVIAALWNVDDASTAALMEDLYTRLARGDAPAEALRQSKLALVRSSSAYRKPFYWAPFLTYTRSPLPASARTAAHP